VLKSILIGLDGSPSSGTAVKLGIQWAKRFNALLVGLGIVDEADIRAPEAESIGGGYYKQERDEELVKEARRSVEQFLEQFKARCAEANVSFNLLEDAGMPYEEILRESQRYDLVLFGHETHFRFGSVDRPDETLWNVLKRGPRPVVIAPPGLETGSSVVVAYNGSSQADRALQAFQSSGLDFREEVCVVSADDNREEANRQAGRAVEFLRLHGINAVACALGPVDSVDQSILKEVRRRNARLLVMGAYGHSTVREFLLGSITKAVLKESAVPVFLCH
jgi:nucleotide-binding universal stress UspA family protein